jgi:hypothetical protein
VEIKTDNVLLDVDMGASDELPLVIMQSFKDGWYSPSTSMEERVGNNARAVYSEWSCCKERSYKY